MSSASPSRHTIDIDRLGGQGDGMGMVDGRQVFVPLALPGEKVIADLEGDHARVHEWVTARPDRQSARCPLYETCGGCSLQHLPDADYLAFKRQMVATPLSQAGVAADVREVIPVAPHSRRRAVLAASLRSGRLKLGFHGRRSHEVHDIDACAVLVPGLMNVLPALRKIAGRVAGRKDGATFTLAETRGGVDLAIACPPLSADARVQLAGSEEAAAFARITVNGDLLLERQAPLLRMGEFWLKPPPGGFLQAVAQAEDNLARLVIDHVCKEGAQAGGQLADLFAGSGTFALRMLAHAAVHAVESQKDAVEALASAARSNASRWKLSTETRDLFRLPLRAAELKRFSAVVLDPPRAGAQAQCKELAASGVRRIAMVSCNPGTLARDLATLQAGGYRVDVVQPVDQFLWSPHIESVALLSR